MITDFLRWWLRQLLDLLQPALKIVQDNFNRAVVVEIGDQKVLLHERVRRRDVLFFTWALDDTVISAVCQAMQCRGAQGRVILRLPPGQLLELSVTIPLAAEREIEQILTYEMDRLTPFPAEQVFWTFSVLQRDHARKLLELRLSLLPRKAVENWTELLLRAGVKLDALELPAFDGDTRVISLEQADERRTRKPLLSLARSTCAIAFSALILPVFLQYLALERVEARISALRPAFEQAEAVRAPSAPWEGAGDLIAVQRMRVGDPLTALVSVAELLPDDTFLDKFTLDQRKLTISGNSASAAKLMSLISGSSSIKNPTFVQALVRSGNGKTDSFSIRAELAQ
jgi:general secretion pathway protein L